MKFIRRLLLLIILIIFIVSTICYLNGKKLYDEVLDKISLEEKIKQIREDEDFTSIDDVPKYYYEAIVAVEDHRFFSHGSIDIISLGRAIVSNIKQKDFKEGGSTKRADPRKGGKIKRSGSFQSGCRCDCDAAFSGAGRSHA